MSHKSLPHQIHPPPGTLPGCAPQFAFSSLFSVTNFSLWTPSLLFVCFWKPVYFALLSYLYFCLSSLMAPVSETPTRPRSLVWSGQWVKRLLYVYLRHLTVNGSWDEGWYCNGPPMFSLRSRRPVNIWNQKEGDQRGRLWGWRGQMGDNWGGS